MFLLNTFDYTTPATIVIIDNNRYEWIFIQLTSKLLYNDFKEMKRIRKIPNEMHKNRFDRSFVGYILELIHILIKWQSQKIENWINDLTIIDRSGDGRKAGRQSVSQFIFIRVVFQRRASTAMWDVVFPPWFHEMHLI